MNYKGREGYVNANTTALFDAGDNVVVAPIVTTNAACMRKGPRRSWPVVGVLTPGSAVNVQKCVSRCLSGWCKVDFKGVSGRMHGPLLKRQGALFN